MVDLDCVVLVVVFCVCVVGGVGLLGFGLCCSCCVSLLICFTSVLWCLFMLCDVFCALLRWRRLRVDFGGLFCW